MEENVKELAINPSVKGKAYLTLGLKALDMGHRLIISGSGASVTRAVSVAELIKREFTGGQLSQETRISRREASPTESTLPPQL
jgi:hypothetical protein